MDNAFLSVIRNVDRMNDEWHKTKTGKAPTASVINLWREGQRMHNFLRDYKTNAAKEYREIASRFSGSYEKEQRMEYEERISSANKAVVSGYRKDIEEFIRDKTERLDGMLTTPPTTNQRELLDSLKLRVGNLSKAEAMRILPVFFDNYTALKAFQEICKDAGYKLYVPLPDVMQLYQDLEGFEKYMNQIADQIGASEPSYIAKSFFYDPDDPSYIEPAIARFSEAFDTVPQLQNHEMDSLTAGEQARINAMFKGIEKLDPNKFSDLIRISGMVQKIVKDHKDDMEMILRSPYGKYVELSTNLEMAKLEAIAEDKASKSESSKLHGGSKPLRTDGVSSSILSAPMYGR